jgi:serine/threonine protein kinase
MKISAGTRLGPYEVLAPIGAGGMGEVWRARDTRLGREVALKVVHPRFAADADQLRRFEQEARAASQLNHPNILVVHDVGSHEGSPYIVSELLDGESLRERLGAPLPPRKAVEYALQVAHGLAAAHEKGIVHRDIKPENLFVTRDGRIKILDFGVAKLTQPEFSSVPLTEVPTAAPSTDAGVVLGTVSYMSPEQVLGKSLDSKSDLFSLGVVLYEMLSGKRPFQKETAPETMSAILREEPPDLTVTNQSVSPGLESVVWHCLEKEPSNRFQSARDVAFALGHLTSATSSAPGTQRGFPQARRWRKGVMAATAVVSLVAAFCVGKWLSPPHLLHVERLTPSPRIISSARFLPDEKSIVYTAAPDGLDAESLGELFRLNPGQPPIPLGVRDCRVLDVSASGELILVWNRERTVDGRKESTPVLARIPSAGGAAPQVVEEEYVHVGDQARWTRDGRDLIVKHVKYKGKSTQVVVFQGRPVYEVPWGFGFYDFNLNDKGDAIRFVEFRAKGRSFVTVGLDGRVISRNSLKDLKGQSIFSVGKRLVFLSRRNGRENPDQLVQLSPSGEFQRVLQNLPTGADLWDVNPAGDILITPSGDSGVQEFRGVTELRWLEPGADRERVLDVESARAPSLNESGTQLICSAGKAFEGYGILLPAGQSTATSLGEGFVLDQARDGKTILNMVNDQDGYYRLRLQPAGAGAPQNLPGKWVHCWDAFLQEGGKAFVYGRLKDDEGRHPYLLDVNAGSPQRLPWPAKDTVAIVDGPVSPDGRTAFAAATTELDSTPWSQVDLSSGALTPLPPGCAGMNPLSWTANGQGIWLTKEFAKDRSFPLELWRCDLKTGKAEKVRSITGPGYPLAKLGNFSITPDGRSYAYDSNYDFPVRKYLFRISGAL